MPNPIEYNPGYSFDGYQELNPTLPLPAQQLDEELAEIAEAINGHRLNIMDIRRSDGKLQNGIVTPESLSPAVNSFLGVDGVTYPFRANVRVVATEPVDMGGEQEIDGVELVGGDRILLTAQASAAQNGIWVVGNTWARAADLAIESDFVGPIIVPVAEGTVGRNKIYSFSPEGAVSVGSTAINFIEGFPGAVLVPGSVGTQELADGGVTLAKLANLDEAHVIGRAAGAGAGVPTALTGAQVTAIANAFTGDSGSGGVKGLVPAPAAGDAAANKVLGASGGWIAPPGATTGVVAYGSRASVIALTVPLAITRIETHGYATAGDYGGGVYDRAGSAPSHAGFFQDAGGAYWVLDADDYVTLEQFGGGTAAASNTAALNSANAYCAATSCKVIQSRVGVYTFTTKPNDINEQVKIKGQGSSVTNWLRAYSEAGGNDVGFITFRELVAGGGGQINGSGLIGIMLTAGNGTTGGTMLREITDGPVTGYTLHDDLVVTYTGTGTYHRCWLVDGLLNTTSGSQGYRDVRARDCFFFKGAAGTETCRFLNATNLDVELWTNGDTVVFGGGTALTNTNNARLVLTSLAQLFVGNSTACYTYGEVDSCIHSSGTTNCVHWGGIGAGGYSNTSNQVTNAVFNRSHGFAATRALPGIQRFPTGLIVQMFQATSVGTAYANYAFPTAFSSGCTPIVIGSVRGAGTFVGTMTGTHSNTNASLAVASGTQTVDCIAIGW